MSDEMISDTNDASFSSLSQVSPKKKASWLSGYRLFLILSFAFAMLLFAFFPHKAQSKEGISESLNEGKELTLEQNLNLIEEMKKSTAPLQNTTSTSIPEFTLGRRLKKNQLSKEMLARMNAPTTFINRTENSAQNGQASNPSPHQSFTGESLDVQFLNQQNDISVARAMRLPHPNYTVPAGEMIEATLETAINPELPGMIRAVTARDVFSLSGGRCLIPRGSKLIGQFNSALVEGQSRILVIWNQVRLANGILVKLNSPGTDEIGRAGLNADYINRHFFERFGTSALFTILGAYTANSGVSGNDENNSRAQYRTALSQSFQQASSQSLQTQGNKTTLQKNQGANIHVFVANDLDFYALRNLR